MTEPALIRMPAISLWQPWASLIAVGLKVHETRHWRFPARLQGQRVLIHAAKRAPYADLDQELYRACREAFGRKWWRKDGIPRGAFVATAVLSGCFTTEEIGPADDVDGYAGDWSEGRFAWRLDDVQALREPIEAKGHQGLWMAEVGETQL